MTRPPALTPGLLAVLAFVATVGPFATDMYLASFTDIAADLGTSASAVQLTLTSFLLGLGAGQLVLGPLSDRWGRRRMLLIALTAFAAAGVAMVFSPSIEAFVVLRLVQGFAGAAGVVLARAIAVDLSTGTTAVQALSLIATLVGLGPLIAPPIGGAVATVWGWRGVLATLAAVSVAMLAFAAWRVPESLPAHRRHRGGVSATLARMAGLLRDARFAGCTVAFSAGFAAMMACISASPFVGQRVLGMDALVYSLAFSASASALVLANLVNARVAVGVGPRRMLSIGVLAIVAGSAAMLVLVLGDALTAAGFIVCAFIVTGGAGLTMSNASALALARTDASSRGSGSALLGATQFLLGGLASPVVGLWGEHTALPMAVVMSVAAVTASVCVLAVNRTRD